MSGMANEMAARMREDGEDTSRMIDPLAPLEQGAAEPGTGREQAPTPPEPPAEALTTDTQGGGEPGPVPYSRFREVNEGYQALRGYEPLMQYGYDPDSLGRLAQFEAAYVQDPHGTVAQLVDNLDLPDEAKTQIREMLDAEAEEPPAGGGTPATPQSDGQEPPPWARELVEDFQSRKQADVQQREQAAQQQALDQVLSHWDALDKKQEIKAGAKEGVKLALISSLASTGRFTSPEQLAEAARSEWVADREAGLGSVVVPGSGIGPRSVPRSAATPAPPQQFGGDIKAATKAAMAAMERGELPPITPGG
jgi:hypothetical protein